MKPNRLGNYRQCLGVYSCMVRCALFLVVGCAAFGQMRQSDPLQPKLQAIYKARDEGRFSDAAALRDEAQRMLASLPPDAPQFGGWVQSVAQLYQSSGRTAQARAVLLNALDRAGVQVQIGLLTQISDSWRQDRSLLKAAEYLKKAISAQEAAPPQPVQPPSASMAVTGFRASRQVRFYSGRDGTLKNLYGQMAGLERQLGHPDAAASWNAKLRALAVQAGGDELAGFLEDQGQFAEAAALRKSAAERAATPDEAAGNLQQLARLYQRQERIDDAVAAQRQAIARIEASGTELRSQATGARETLARILQQAGRTQQADAVYLDMLSQAPAGQEVRLVSNFANYLTSTQRAPQALAVLKEYWDSHAPLQPDDESSLSFALANAARVSGDVRQAEEYQSRGNAVARQNAPDTYVRPQLDVLLEKAQAAANAGRTDEALALATQAIDAASRAPNREQIGWMIPTIASTLSGKKAAAQGDQLYRYALSMAESWSEESLQPLLNLLSNRAPFLIGQPERRTEASDVIERYRSLLIAAHGAESGVLDEPMRMMVQLQLMRNRPPASMIPAQDLVAYEEAVNGTTSEPYLQALQTLADLYDYNGEWQHTIPVRKQIVALADLVYASGDYQRAQARANLAMALANHGEFDEAERVAAEAIQETKGKAFEHVLQQVRQMRAQHEAAAKR